MEEREEPTVRDVERVFATSEPLPMARRTWLLLAGMLPLAVRSPSVCAQPFFAHAQASQGVILLRREDDPHFTLSVQYAQWRNPYQYRVTVGSLTSPEETTKTLRVVADTPASPLFEIGYKLGPRWHLGLWYNPIRGERLRKTAIVGDQRISLQLDRDADLADLHFTYLGPRGSSVQLGYYREWYAVRDRVAQTPPQHNALTSWNFWLTQQLDVRVRRATLTPFVSLGYHPSSDLNHAVSVLAGVTLAFHRHWDFSGSVWLFDLSNPATRLTGGLVYWF